MAATKIYFRDKTLKLKGTFDDFVFELNKKYPELNNSKYFCICVWCVSCQPCVSEIPHLISLFKKEKTVTPLVFVSRYSETACVRTLKLNGIDPEKMFLVCNMNSFISGIFNEIKLEFETFPMHVVIDHTSNLLAYLEGNIENPIISSRLMGFIDELE